MHWARLHFLQGCAGIKGMFHLMDHVVCTKVITLTHVILLVFNIGEVLNVWLQLLEQDKAEGYQSLFINITQVFSFFHGIDIQENVILLL